MAKLGDVCTLINGYAFKPSDWSERGLPIIRIQNLNDENASFNYFAGSIDSKYIVKNGDLLFSWSGTPGTSFGAFFWNRGEGVLNQHIFNVYPDDSLYKPYFRYALNGNLERIISKAHGGVGLQHITKKELENIEISIPAMEVQRHIVRALDKVSGLIALRKQQLAKLDELVKARFVELFGDPVSNPMRWQECRFDSLCENLDYRRKPITASERETGIYPYYGASGIVDYVADYIFDEDILLVSEDGANLLMRSTPIAFSVSGKVWVNNHAHVVKFEKMSMQKYIEVFFSLIDISDHITGSAQPKLNQAKLNAMIFPVPNEERLDTFLQFIEQTDKSKLEIQTALTKLETLKKALMQQYFG